MKITDQDIRSFQKVLRPAGEGTLADAIIRESYRPQHKSAPFMLLREVTPVAVRNAIASARKFVLDDAMAAFIADLSLTPLVSVAKARRPGIMDSIRHGARLPFPKVWIEYTAQPFRKRLIELGGLSVHGDPLDESDHCSRHGVLLEEHPNDPRVIRMLECADYDEFVAILCHRHMWQHSDGEPSKLIVNPLWGMLGIGLTNYSSPYVGAEWLGERERDGSIPKHHLRPVRIKNDGTTTSDAVPYMLTEWTGSMRYMMALLATLNDVPVVRREVQPSKGYIARGQRRKFVDHTVLTLNVPMRVKTERLAKRLIGLAAKRARHTVRGHWRHYQRGEGSLCPSTAHEWQAADARGHAQCSRCRAWRTWIPHHERGDASLGYTLHDYAVTHDE